MEPVDLVAPLTACAAVAEAVEDEDVVAALAWTGGTTAADAAARSVGAAPAIGFPFASVPGSAAAPAPSMLLVEFEAPNELGSDEPVDEEESLEHMSIVFDHPPDVVDHCIPASSHPYGHSQSQEIDSSPIPYWYDCCHEDMSVPDIMAEQEVDEAVDAEDVVVDVELLIAAAWNVVNDFVAVGLIANTIPCAQ